MKILDGMACGLPVITPLFGGPTAYCRSDNCFPVDFSLVPMGDCLDTRSLHIANQPMWAEVSRQSLSQQMRRVHDERLIATQTATRAQAEVLERFSWGSAADSVIEITTRLRAASAAGVAADGRTRAHSEPTLAVLARPANQRGRAHAQPEGEAARLSGGALAAVDPAAGIRSRGRRRWLNRWDEGCTGPVGAFLSRCATSGRTVRDRARHETWESSRRPARSCSSLATTSSPMNGCSKSICWPTPSTPSLALRCSAISTGRSG